jgi:hypothetical protein
MAFNKLEEISKFGKSSPLFHVLHRDGQLCSLLILLPSHSCLGRDFILRLYFWYVIHYSAFTRTNIMFFEGKSLINIVIIRTLLVRSVTQVDLVFF